MSDFDEALKRYQAAEYLANYARARFLEAKQEIVKVCIHPEDHRGTTSWHHGYGKYITSPMCKLCGAVDIWNRGKWTSAEDWNEVMSNRHLD